jgi:hypothetical protein
VFGRRNILGHSFQINRHGVSSEGCVSDDQEFATDFGISNTKANCLLAKDHLKYPNCSLIVYYGVDPGVCNILFLFSPHLLTQYVVK